MIRKPLLVCFAGALVVGGCAGGSLKRVDAGNDLPHDLPKDLQQKFEIKDEPAPAPQPSPVPLQSNAEPRRRKRHAAKKVVEAKPVFQFPNRRPVKDPIWIGEEQVFEITYLGMAAGTFTVDVLPYKEVGSRKVYDVKGTATSSKLFNLFYRLNDTVETFIDYDGLFSHRFHLVLDETKQTRDALELYDSEKAQTYYWNRWNHKDRGYTETKEFQPIQPFSQDSFSALFYLREVPLPPGAVLTFPVVSEGKSWDAVVTVVRREIVDSPLGRVQTVVVKPETKYQGVLQKRGDSFIWLTDDDRRYVVRLEAKVRIGSVVATLKKVEPGTPPAASP